MTKLIAFLLHFCDTRSRIIIDIIDKKEKEKLCRLRHSIFIKSVKNYTIITNEK